MILTKKEIDNALIGLILGDGHYRYGHVTNLHTNKQRFYVEWLEELCKKFDLKYGVRYDFIINTTFGEYLYSDIKIWVLNRNLFDQKGIILNTQGKKYPSDYMLNNINRFGLLLWYLDDGQLHVSFKGNKGKRFAYLNTHSFSYEENQKIQNMFMKRFGISTSLHKDNSGFDKNKYYYRIYFNAENFRKFYDVVREYLPLIPKQFHYKFNMKYVPNRLKSSQLMSELYNCN